jgi:hypothetical protein
MCTGQAQSTLVEGGISAKRIKFLDYVQTVGKNTMRSWLLFYPKHTLSHFV